MAGACGDSLPFQSKPIASHFPSHYSAAMDAVLIAIVAIAPFAIVAGLIAFWVRRAPEPAIAKRRRIISFTIVIACIGIGANWTSLTQTKIFRKLTGTCAVVLSNESGADLKDLDITFRPSEGEPYSYHYNAMSSLARSRFETKTQRLTIQTLKGTAGTNSFTYTAALNRGQCLTLQILPTGKISAQLD